MNQKGIKGVTIISLIVTIIVLLILAGVSISAISGSGTGIINNAKNQKDDMEKAEEFEKIQTAVIKEIQFNPTGKLTNDNEKLSSILASALNMDNVELTTNTGSWTFEGKTGSKYKIYVDGNVEKINNGVS